MVGWWVTGSVRSFVRSCVRSVVARRMCCRPSPSHRHRCLPRTHTHSTSRCVSGESTSQQASVPIDLSNNHFVHSLLHGACTCLLTYFLRLNGARSPLPSSCMTTKTHHCSTLTTTVKPTTWFVSACAQRVRGGVCFSPSADALPPCRAKEVCWRKIKYASNQQTNQQQTNKQTNELTNQPLVCSSGWVLVFIDWTRSSTVTADSHSNGPAWLLALLFCHGRWHSYVARVAGACSGECCRESRFAAAAAGSVHVRAGCGWCC